MSTSHSPTKTSFTQHLASVFARKWTAEWIWGTVKKQAMEAPTRWEDPLKTEGEKKFQRTVGWFSNTKYRTMTACILLSGFHVFLCRFPFLCGSSSCQVKGQSWMTHLCREEMVSQSWLLVTIQTSQKI